jgi:DNA-binding CsgD family transcriptional regulator
MPPTGPAAALATLPDRRGDHIRAATMRFHQGNPEVCRAQSPNLRLMGDTRLHPLGGAAMLTASPEILERDGELTALAAATAGARAGRGTFVLVDGPAGIGKTTLLRAVCAREGGPDMRILSARGLALERDFPYGIVRQLIEPVRLAITASEWAGLLDGAAGLAARVFDWTAVGSAEDDVTYATMHGLYWLIANLAAQQPLVIVVDDAHWADNSSLRWLAHLAARIESLPVALLLAVRCEPGPDLLDDLRAAAACQPLHLAPFGAGASAAFVRHRLGADADAELCRACQASTGGNPFLLESLTTALRAARARPGDAVAQAERLGPEPVAQSVLRQVGQLGDGAVALTQAVVSATAQVADRLRAADVFAPGSLLEFAHPIVQAAIYEAIPPSERGLAHERAARLLERDGADAERLALHLLRSEPGSRPHVVALLRAAATAASGRGAADTAADYLRRALDEPPDPAARPAVLLDLGLALAEGRRPAAPEVLREAVELSAGAREHATAALLSARALSLWGHHDTMIVICRDALAADDGLDATAADSLEEELVANAWVSPATSEEARARTRRHQGLPDSRAPWHVHAALADLSTAGTAHLALADLDPVLTGQAGELASDSLAAMFTLLVLALGGELILARQICDVALDAARSRGSMSMVANMSSMRSMILRRTGSLDDAAADGKVALDFNLATSPPAAVAWAATFCIEALIRLGRLDEADEIAATATARKPPAGWIHTVLFLQSRGALRVAQRRFDDGLADLSAAGDGWRDLGIDSPCFSSWRVDAALARFALGQPEAASALAAEQLGLARTAGQPITLAVALRTYAATSGRQDAEACLAEAISLLTPTAASYELGLTLADLGAHLRRIGRRSDAREPLLRALDIGQRTGARPLSAQARAELLAVGARPRRTAVTGPEALTSAERRVAVLAADGLTNRQIAQHLFVTMPTVETHLRHVFRKLGISSRSGLPAHLAPRS